MGTLRKLRHVSNPWSMRTIWIVRQNLLPLKLCQVEPPTGLLAQLPAGYTQLPSSWGWHQTITCFKFGVVAHRLLLSESSFWPNDLQMRHMDVNCGNMYEYVLSKWPSTSEWRKKHARNQTWQDLAMERPWPCRNPLDRLPIRSLDMLFFLFLP